MFDIKHIRQEDLPYVGLLKAVLGYVDTEHYGYADLSNEINLQTGGISNNILVTADVEHIEEYSLKFEIRTKFLDDKTGAAPIWMMRNAFMRLLPRANPDYRWQSAEWDIIWQECVQCLISPKHQKFQI